MSLIPSESYSFPDHFTRTVTHSSPHKKESSTAVEEAPRRKKRFSFSFRKSQGKRKKELKDQFVLPEDWQNDLAAPVELEEEQPAALTESLAALTEPEPPPAPVVKKKESEPKAKALEPARIPVPKAKEPEVVLPIAKAKPAPPKTPAPAPVSSSEWAPAAKAAEPAPTAKKILLPQPIRKAVAKQPAIDLQPQLPLKNGATEPAPLFDEWSSLAVPPEAKPAPQKMPPAPENGAVEKVISPAGLAQFFQPIVPPTPPPPIEPNVPEQPAASEVSSQMEPAEPPTQPAGVMETGGLEVPMTPELLAQLFKAMIPSQLVAEPENIFPVAPSAPEPPQSLVESAPVAEPPLMPPQDFAPPAPFPEVPQTFEPSPQPEWQPIAPEPSPAPAEFFAPPPAAEPRPPMPQEHQEWQPIAPEPNPAPAEFFPPPPVAKPRPLAPQNTYPAPTDAQRRLSAQPRRSALPPNMPPRPQPPPPRPVVRPEPRIRRSSVPANLKRKVRWNTRAGQEQQPSLPVNHAASMAEFAPPLMPPAPPPPAIRVQQPRPAQDFYQMFAPEPPAEPSMMQPTEPPEVEAQAAPEWARQAPATEMRTWRPREYNEMRRRSLKMRRFIACELVAFGVLIPLAALGFSRVFSDPALVIIIDSFAIAAAVAAAILPIFFFAVTSPFPRAESDYR